MFRQWQDGKGKPEKDGGTVVSLPTVIPSKTENLLSMKQKPSTFGKSFNFIPKKISKQTEWQNG